MRRFSAPDAGGDDEKRRAHVTGQNHAATLRWGMDRRDASEKGRDGAMVVAFGCASCAPMARLSQKTLDSKGTNASRG
jgi:hypothetical protein